MEAIRPEKVYVTSNYTPREIWSDSQLVSAIEDRFELVDARNWEKRRTSSNADKWASIIPAVNPFDKANRVVDEKLRNV